MGPLIIEDDLPPDVDHEHHGTFVCWDHRRDGRPRRRMSREYAQRRPTQAIWAISRGGSSRRERLKKGCTVSGSVFNQRGHQTASFRWRFTGVTGSVVALGRHGT